MEHYDTLGVDKNASPEDLKKAYRKRASKAHPDRPGGDVESFQKVQRAFMVLSDSVRRERYDASGGRDDRDPAANALQAQACTGLSQMFSAAVEAFIDQLGQVDLVEAVQSKILEGRGTLVKNLAEQKARAKKLAALEARIHRKAESKTEVHFLENVAAEKLRVANLNIDSIEKALQVNQLMETLLSVYEYSTDPSDFASMVFVSNSTTSTGTGTW